MARKVGSFDVGGNSYSFTQLPAHEAVDVHMFLTSVFGDLIGGGLQAITGGGGIENMDIDTSKLGQALMGALRKENRAEAKEHIGTLLKSVRFNANGLSLNDGHFDGKIMHLYKVLGMAMEVNFSDFLEELGGVLEKGRKLLATIQERRTSSGSNGDQSSLKAAQ